MLTGLIVGFIAGCLFTCWRFHVTSGPLLRQACVVARAWAESTRPVGPEIQKLGRMAYLRGKL